MRTLSVGVLAVVLSLVAVYVHFRIPSHTAGSTRVMSVRAVLIVVGLAFGYVVSRNFADVESAFGILLLIAAFGMVHLPAAVILFVKQQRGAGRS